METQNRTKDSTISHSRISANEFRKLISASKSPRDRLMIRLFYGLGLNLNELSNLKKSDIDLNRRRIHIRAEHTKSRVSRILPLSITLVSALKSYKAKEYLFYTRQSPKISNRRIEQIIGDISKKAGLKHLTPRVLRKTYIRNSLESGTDQRTVQKSIGTTSLRFKRYISAKDLDSMIGSISSLRDRAIFTMLKETGCTAKELVGLKWSEVNLEQKSVMIDKSRNLSTKLTRLLRSIKGVGYVFSTRQSKRMTIRRIQQLMRLYLKETGIKATPNSIRNASVKTDDILIPYRGGT